MLLWNWSIKLFQSGLSVDDRSGADNELVFRVQFLQESDSSHFCVSYTSDIVDHNLSLFERWSRGHSRCWIWLWVEQFYFGLRELDFILCKTEWLQEILLHHSLDTVVIKHILNQSYGDRGISIVYIWNVGRTHRVSSCIIDKVINLFDLGPVPIKVPWCLLILKFEKTSVLQVHKSNNFLISIVHDKYPSQIVEVCLCKTALSGTEDDHRSEDFHLVVLFGHFCF